MLRDMLKLAGVEVGRKHVSTLMKKLSIEALYRKANTSRRNQAHRIYPYLLRKLTIDRPNQVWAMDTTYIPMQRGLLPPNPEVLAFQNSLLVETGDDVVRCMRGFKRKRHIPC